MDGRHFPYDGAHVQPRHKIARGTRQTFAAGLWGMRVNMKSLYHSVSSMIALGAAMGAGQALAQEVPTSTSEAEVSPFEIVVTAQRRAEKSVDVPITITSLGSAALEDAGVKQLSDISKIVPSLRFDKTGVYSQPTIRGVGTAISTSGGGPNVATYVDGFFLPSSAASDFQLMRTNSIQVLKGPQGTLFGRNTTGGAILVTTSDPSETQAAELRASYSRFDTAEVQGYATTALTSGLAVDLEGLYRRSDGFHRNIVDGNNKIGQYERWSVRTGFKAEISPDVSLLVRYSHSEASDATALMHNAFVDGDGKRWVYEYTPEGSYATAPNEVALNPADPIGVRTNADVLQATIKADLGFANLTSYTQLRDERVTSVQDLDATALPVFTMQIGSNNKAFTQELLLSSKAGGPLQWTLGGYYFRNRDTWLTAVRLGTGPFANNGASGTLSQAVAVFGDLTYEVVPNLFITAGARYSHDWVTEAFFQRALTAGVYEDVNGEAQDFATLDPVPSLYEAIYVPKLKNNRVTPRVVIRYKPDDSSSVYASFTQGYKAGLLNVGGYSFRPVKPETINAYEVGYKYSQGMLTAEVSGFYYDYKNLQVSSYQAGTARIRNAASSEIYGLEAQLSARITPDFTLSGGVGWTHARYKSFKNAALYMFCDGDAVPCPAEGLGAGSLIETVVDASGYKMQRTPEVTANIAAAYGLDVAEGRLNLSSNLYYTSAFYFGIAEQFQQKKHALLGLRAEWTDADEKYSVAIFGDNVTNHRYRAAVNYASLGIGSVWAAPATYGVTLGVKY